MPCLTWLENAPRPPESFRCTASYRGQLGGSSTNGSSAKTHYAPPSGYSRGGSFGTNIQLALEAAKTFWQYSRTSMAVSWTVVPDAGL